MRNTLKIVCVLLCIVFTVVNIAAQDGLSLKSPAGVAFDRGGQLIVSDTGNHRLLVFNSEFNFVYAIGTHGKGDGEFDSPRGIAIDSNGRIIVSDSGNNRIVILSRNFGFLKSFGEKGNEQGQLKRPFGLATDSQDNIIVADTFNNRIQVFDKNGKFLKSFGERGPGLTQFSEPGGVIFDWQGRLLIANGWNSRIDIYNYDPQTIDFKHLGKEEGQLGGFWLCDDVAVDSQKHIIGLNTNGASLIIYDSKGKKIKEVRGDVFGRFRSPRAIAVNSHDQIAIADTDNNRIVILNPDFKFPPRPTITDITPNGATIKWTTLKPAVSELEYWRRIRTSQAVGESLPPGEGAKRVTKDTETTEHIVELENLSPATEYRFRVNMPSAVIIPRGGMSQEYAFTTRPAEGETSFWRAPILVFILANVINVDTLTKDAPPPKPAPPERIQYYRDELKKAVLFYWVNSSMALFLDTEVVIVEDMFEIGKNADPKRKLQTDEELKKYWKRSGKRKEDYDGIVVITAERRWNAKKKEYYYQGSGGGTWGINYPSPGRSQFLGGSDISWLFVHEVHHQVDSYYNESGYEEFLFNHFSPTINTAFHTGEHYDGNAYTLRVWPRDKYFFCKYGQIMTATDSDDDGIPDDEPMVPLDEKRLGSDPHKKDSDDDGLTDMEELLTSIWNWELLDSISNTHADYLRPNLRNPDTDGDGIRDGDDPYPIYAAPDVIEMKTPTLDGKIEADEWLHFYDVKVGGKLVASLYLQWDAYNLYYGFVLDPKIAEVRVQTDFENDGWYVGKDNYWIPIQINSGGKKWGIKLGDFWVNNCATDKWPFPDRKILQRNDIFIKGAKVANKSHIELAIPRNTTTGLKLDFGETIGFAVNFLLEKGTDKWVSAFEPYVLFDVTLVSGRGYVEKVGEDIALTLEVEDQKVARKQKVKLRMSVKNIGEDNISPGRMVVNVTSNPLGESTRRRVSVLSYVVAETLRSGDSTQHLFDWVIPQDEPLGVLAFVGQFSDNPIMTMTRVEVVEPLSVEVVTDGSKLITKDTGFRRKITVKVYNNMPTILKGKISLSIPKGWGIAPDGAQAVEIEKYSEVVFSIAMPESLSLGEYTITAKFETDAKNSFTKPLTFHRPIDWLVIGPFDNKNKIGFDTVYTPEREIDLNAVYNVDGKEVKWKPIPTESFIEGCGINLQKVFKKDEWVTVYALTYIYTAEEKEAELRVGSDDTITVWLNDEVVISENVYRPAKRNQNRANIILDAGWNKFLVKICQGGGEWAFYFELVDANGKELDGLMSKASLK